MSKESAPCMIAVACAEPQVLVAAKLALAPHFDVQIAANSDAVLNALSEFDIAAIIVCIGEKRDEAFELFRNIQGQAASGNVPILFLAEKGSDEDETAAFEIGAADYTVKRQGTIGALAKRINLRISAGAGSAASESASPESVLAGKCILLADDVELNRYMVSELFTGIDGFSIVEVCDGDEAVAAFAEAPEKFAMILMDVLMPAMDGLEAAKAIRALDCKGAKDVPIIALTASPLDEDIDNCLAAGMNDFVKKPITREPLLKICAKHCV